ncbi:MAG: DUF3488 domain-containing transglutaminase family protein [Gammaproteobacteria bacterium]|nr:DUF3488 domain-containing transglutaminase family protein [Gammaproteobacteria bacterium]
MDWIPRNVLILLLVALAMVILPHVVRLPIWITLICVACCAWRIMVFRGLWSYPGRWVKALFVFGGFLSVGFGYGTLLGLEPWIAALILAFVLKLLEMHQLRDAHTVIVLAYFVALTEFLFEQSIPYMLYIYACTTVITAALIGLNQEAANVSLQQVMKKASVMLLQAMPFMLVLFVLFPRIAPLWTVPFQTNIARTGVTDTLVPGNIAQLVQSDELAFRATFEGPVPSSSLLYWRGIVLSYFDRKEQAWTQQRPGVYGRTLQSKDGEVSWKDNMEYLGDEVKYSIVMEPTNQNWVFSLTLPEAEGAERMGLMRDFRFYSFQEINSKFRYELTSHLDSRMDISLSDFWRYRYTLLPDNDNPKTSELAESLRASSDTPEEYISNVMLYYATEGFVYTLRPPILTGDTIDEFLVSSRRGFCEHFASSFVYLMRRGGLPARIVVGYQGGEYNRRGNYVAVHQFDAHAWSEVWLEGRGWVRVDPTSVVSPERIESGLESAVEGEFLSDIGLSMMKFRSSLIITELRLQLSALNHYWDAWVVGYTPSVQMSMLNRYLGELNRQTLGMILVSVFLGMLGFTALLLLLRRSQHELAPADREYLKFCRYLANQGLERSMGEGPISYARRVATSRPDLATSVDAVTDAYIRVNFIDDRPEDVGTLRKAVRRVRLSVLAGA